MNKFKLIVDGDSVRELTIAKLQEAVFNLKDDTDSFIVLEPKEPIDNSIYIQAICQEDKYIAETRLIFDNTDNYNHYSKKFNTKEELFDILRYYYEEVKLPDIRTWIDENSNFIHADTGDEMIKLYTTNDQKIRYFEVWLNDHISLTIHTGEVGDVGITEDIIYDEEGDLPIRVAMQQLISEQKKIGYHTINLTELIIQYTYDKEQENDNSIIEQKEKLETILNESLGWTGNGHCEGGDAEAGITNLYCYTVDKNIALGTILKDLNEENSLSNLKIGYADEKTEEYIMLYPQKGSFNLI